MQQATRKLAIKMDKFFCPPTSTFLTTSSDSGSGEKEEEMKKTNVEIRQNIYLKWIYKYKSVKRKKRKVVKAWLRRKFIIHNVYTESLGAPDLRHRLLLLDKTK